jgi:hypothetical protein
MATSIPADKAALVLATLKDQTNSLIGQSEQVQLDLLQVQGSGSFPYYYQDPNNLKFNKKTYDWISQHVEKRNGQAPISLDGSYNNQFGTAITAIAYTLSRADQAKLTEAREKAVDHRSALVNVWSVTYGKPSSDKVAIDEIFGVVLKDWTSKENASMMDILSAPDLHEFLDKAPTSGHEIKNLIGNYLDALGEGVPLQNSITLNNGILRRVRNAVNRPTEKNGAIELNEGGIFVPEYKFSEAPGDLLNKLRSDDNKIEVQLKMTDITESETNLSVGGDASFKMPLEFFDFSLGAEANFFTKIISKTSTTIEIDMTFKGITVVKFGPEAFELSSSTGWHYNDAIKEAVKLGDQDVSGFKFSPRPNYDFEVGGDFGIINAVAFCQYPAISIKITTKDYKEIKAQLDANANAGMKIDFLGMSLGVGLDSEYTQKGGVVNETEGSVSFTLNPPEKVIGDVRTNATAFILGVQTEYTAVE